MSLIIKKVEAQMFAGSLLDDCIKESIFLSKILTYRFPDMKSLEQPVEVSFNFNGIILKVDENSDWEKVVEEYHRKTEEI